MGNTQIANFFSLLFALLLHRHGKLRLIYCLRTRLTRVLALKKVSERKVQVNYAILISSFLLKSKVCVFKLLGGWSRRWWTRDSTERNKSESRDAVNSLLNFFTTIESNLSSARSEKWKEKKRRAKPLKKCIINLNASSRLINFFPVDFAAATIPPVVDFKSSILIYVMLSAFLLLHSIFLRSLRANIIFHQTGAVW